MRPTLSSAIRLPGIASLGLGRLLGFSLAAVLVAAPTALGQIVRLEQETIRSVTLSPAQRERVETFVEHHAPRAFGENPADASAAIDELLEPVRDDRVSVALRQAFSSLLIERIEEALADERVWIEGENGDDRWINPRPFNALRVGGEVATEQTLRAIVPQLEHDDPGRSFFAIHAIETLFSMARMSAPAVSAGSFFQSNGDTSEGVLPRLGELVAETESPRHAAAAVRALREASRIGQDQVPGVSSRAVLEIARSASARIRRTPPDRMTLEEKLVWLSAGWAVQSVVAQDAADADLAREAIRLAGQMVGAVFRMAEADKLPPMPDRQEGSPEGQILGMAQNLLGFGEQNHAEATGRQPSRSVLDAADALLSAYRGEADRRFRQVALRLVSTNGLLTDRPYAFDDDEFVGD